MQRILQHIKIIGNLEKINYDLDFIKKCDLQDLINCYKRIETNKIDSNLYHNNLAIQKELIIDEPFTNYFIELNKNDINIERVESLCSKLQDKQEKVSDYSLETLIELLRNENFIKDSFYDYLKYFSSKTKSKEEQNIVADNLSYFYQQNEVTMQELSEEERNLFLHEYMSSYNLIPIDHIKKVCEFLVQDNGIKNIILFLYSHNLQLPLKLRYYELIHNNSNTIFEYIQKLNNLLDNETMYQLLLRWLENGCTLYDFKILDSKLQVIDKKQIDKIVCNRSGYINFLFGNKLNNFPLEDVYGDKERLLIYAISNRKKSFLKLIQENSKEFLDISQNSILFEQNFYEKYINLNILTLKNLQDLQSMQKYNSRLSYLNGENYTFEEISLLYNIPDQYVRLYNFLMNLKVDERIIVLKQLLKRELLSRAITDDELQILADKLKVQHLYNWIEKDFSNISGLKPENAIKILLNYEKVKKFIPEIYTETELLYVLRNIDIIQDYDSLDTVKKNIENVDVYWNEFVKLMEFTPEFIEENKHTIKHFLLNNGAELALKYSKSCRNKDLASFKNIVKSELMGKFWDLKYYTDDLKKEIDFDLKDKQKSEWTSNNLMISNGEIQVQEYDDFYSTMILGESPQHTCLSYKNGAYNHCLMACFDSNKKILYAKINGQIVARAMVRLTKGAYSIGNGIREKKLSFVDLENIPNSNEEITPKKDEYLTLFLEKPYIAGVSSEQEKEIKKMFITLLEKKAILMNCLLVLNSDYSNTVSRDYVITRYHMYISKSKAGVQYLDSLSGENTVTDEGQYKGNTFVIWQNQNTLRKIQ